MANLCKFIDCHIKILIGAIYFQTTLLFDATILEFIPPCGLHLILAHHRYMWKFLHSIISKRSQEELFPVALRKIGCSYLAFQLDSYFKRYFVISARISNLNYQTFVIYLHISIVVN